MFSRSRNKALGLVCLALVLWCWSTAAQAQTITIGAVHAVNSPLKEPAGQNNDGLRDAVAMVNLEGGVNGKTVNYVFDVGTLNLDLSKKLFEEIQKKYSAPIMFGESTDFGKNFAQEIKDKYQVLYCSPSFSSELAQQAMFPSIFVMGPTFGDQFGICLKFIAKEKPGARVAFYYSDTAFGKDPIKFGKLMCDRLRLPLVAEEAVPMNSADVSASAKLLIERNPDYVLMHGFVDAAMGKQISMLRKAGVKSTFVTTNWGVSPAALEALGDDQEGYYGASPFNGWWMEDVPGIKKLREFGAKQHPDVTYRPPTYLHGYVTGLVFLECLRRADRQGTVTYDALVKALHGLKDFDTGGITAPLTNKNNRFPVARMWKANMTNKRFEPVSDWINLYIE